MELNSRSNVSADFASQIGAVLSKFLRDTTPDRERIALVDAIGTLEMFKAQLVDLALSKPRQEGK